MAGFAIEGYGKLHDLPYGVHIVTETAITAQYNYDLKAGRSIVSLAILEDTPIISSVIRTPLLPATSSLCFHQSVTCRLRPPRSAPSVISAILPVRLTGSCVCDTNDCAITSDDVPVTSSQWWMCLPAAV